MYDCIVCACGREGELLEFFVWRERFDLPKGLIQISAYGQGLRRPDGRGMKRWYIWYFMPHQYHLFFWFWCGVKGSIEVSFTSLMRRKASEGLSLRRRSWCRFFQHCSLWSDGRPHPTDLLLEATKSVVHGFFESLHQSSVTCRTRRHRLRRWCCRTCWCGRRWQGQHHNNRMLGWWWAVARKGSWVTKPCRIQSSWRGGGGERSSGNSHRGCASMVMASGRAGGGVPLLIIFTLNLTIST